MSYLQDAELESRDAVFAATLRAIEQAIACDGISILEVLPDQGMLVFRASKTMSRDLLKGFGLKLDQGIASSCALRGEGVIVNDVGQAPQFCDVVDRALRFQTRAVMCCPLRKDGAVVGVVELINRVDGAGFSEADLAATGRLVDTLIAQCPGRIEDSCEELLTNLLTGVAGIVPVEGISVLTFNETRDRLVFRATDTKRALSLESARIGIGQGIVGWVAREGMPLLVANAQEDPRFFRGVDVVSKFLSHSILAVPVQVGGRIGAVIELVNSPRGGSFTHRDLATVQAVAAELGAALARLS